MVHQALPRRKCLVVSVEAPWPAFNGGRERIAQVIEQLATNYDVTVIYPVKPGETIPDAPSGVNQRAVETAVEPRLMDRLSLLPRLGNITLRAISPELKNTLDQLRPDFIYWSHSYLAAVGMKSIRDRLNLVEFANIEGRRSLSLSRSSARLRNKISALAEYIKSLWWEPRCARRANMVISLHHQEAAVLQRYGAEVILVQNGFSQHEYVPSPGRSRRILAIGSWSYGPNRSAIEAFLENEWIEIHRQDPSLKLVIAGWGSGDLLNGKVSSVPQVLALGFVEDLSRLFQECFCLLAPASSGGGSQLKIAEAFSHHRPVIGPAFLSRELSPEMPDGVIIASNDLVGSIVELAKSPRRRRLLEDRLRAFVATRTWLNNFSPVVSWLDETLREKSVVKEPEH